MSLKTQGHGDRAVKQNRQTWGGGVPRGGWVWEGVLQGAARGRSSSPLPTHPLGHRPRAQPGARERGQG